MTRTAGSLQLTQFSYDNRLV